MQKIKVKYGERDMSPLLMVPGEIGVIVKEKVNEGGSVIGKVVMLIVVKGAFLLTGIGENWIYDAKADVLNLRLKLLAYGDVIEIS